MTKPLIIIEERMHSTDEVASIIGHRVGYVLRLIEIGELRATRPRGPGGAAGQWRVYPKSLREHLGVREPRRVREKKISRKAESEIAEGLAILGD